MSPISTTQQGLIAEQEFMKLLMLGSGGDLEVSKPVTDDERRDLETHIRGQFTPSLIFQVKSTTHVDHRFKARRLSIHFPVAKATPELRGDTWSFNFCPSLEPDARDHWRKYQHSTKEVGKYVLHVLRTQILAATPLLAAGSSEHLPEGVIWVRPT